LRERTNGPFRFSTLRCNDAKKNARRKDCPHGSVFCLIRLSPNWNANWGSNRSAKKRLLGRAADRFGGTTVGKKPEIVSVGKAPITPITLNFSLRYAAEMLVLGADLSDWKTGNMEMIQDYMKPLPR